MAASSSFMLALSMGGVNYPWLSTPILALFAAALVLGIAFIVRLRTAPEPLIPLSILSNREARLAIAANAFGWGPIVGLHIFLPMYLQNIVGMAPATAGLSVLMLAVTLNISAGITGTILPRRERYKTIPIVGLTLAIAAVLMLAWRAKSMTLLEFEVLLFLIGAGFGCMPPLSATALQNNVSIHTFGSAVATMQFSRNLFATILVAVFGVIVLSGVARPAASRRPVFRRGLRPCVPRGRRELRGRARRGDCCWTKSRSKPSILRRSDNLRFCAILRQPPAKRRDAPFQWRRPRPARRKCHGFESQISACPVRLRAGVAGCAAKPRADAKYPDHPVKVVIGFTAGGGTDVAARVIAQKLSEAMGQSFVVENRPGASGLIASEQVAKAPADGYTIMVGSQTTLAVAPALYKKFQFDATKELTGLAMIGISPLVAVVNAELADPLDQGPDRRSQGQERHDELRLGRRRHHAAHGGRAVRVQRRHQDGARRLSRRSAGHQRSARRTDPVHVLQPVGGEGQRRGRQAARARRDQLQARALAAGRADASPRRSRASTPRPGSRWSRRPALPRDAVMRINAETKKIVATPDFQQRLDAIGMFPDQDRTPDEINAYIKAEIAKWAKVIADAGVKPAD